MPRRSFTNQYALDQLVEQQRGVVTYRQLTDLGVPSATIAYLSRTGGPWRRILPGVYLAFSGPPSWWHRVRAALLYAGESAMLTGLAALRMYGFKEAADTEDVHVLIPHDRRRVSRSFLRVERSTIAPPEVLRVGELPCAPLPRAVADACRFVRRKNAVRAIVAEAVQKHSCTVAELWTELKSGSRRGSALLREALVELMAGIRSALEAESRDFFHEFGLPEPLWNVALYTRDGVFLGIVDGYLEKWGIVVEANSVEYHFALPDWEESQIRLGRLSIHRLITVPVTSNRLRTDRSGLAADFWAAIRQAEGRPRPDVVIGSPPPIRTKTSTAPAEPPHMEPVGD